MCITWCSYISKKKYAFVCVCLMYMFVAVCCSVLQCIYIFSRIRVCVSDVHVFCSVLLCVAVCCSVLYICLRIRVCASDVQVCCSVLQCVVVCCSVLQCVAVYIHLFTHLCVYVWCTCLLQCVAVCCSVLQCVALCIHLLTHSCVYVWCTCAVYHQFTRERDIYGVATISRLLKMIGHFCKTALWKRLYSAKKTFEFKEPTNRSHPIERMRKWEKQCDRERVRPKKRETEKERERERARQSA